MANETRYYRLEKLVKWDKCSEVNEMLLAGVAPLKVSEWCKANGFSISQAKLYDYKEMLQKATVEQVTVERLLGIGVPRRTPIMLQALGLADAKNLVRTELEVLDGIIQRGFSGLLSNPEIKVSDALKAIEMKHKLTGGAHGGLTGYGLDQLRDLETRKFQAIIDVVMKYLPEDKYDELNEAVAIAERSFYEDEAPELLDEYEQTFQEQLAEDIHATIVSG